jgi:hypothetical protein
MSIWRHRDSEPPDEEDHETEAGAGEHERRAPGEPDYQAAAAGDQPAPAFWRAQGGAPPPFGRPPGSGYVPAEPAAQTQAPEPAHAPEPGRDDDMVVLDSETAVKDPALAGTAREPAAAGPASDPTAGHGVVTAGDTEAAREQEAARGAEAARDPEAQDGGAAHDAAAGHGVVTAGDTEAAHETEAARDPEVTQVPPAAGAEAEPGAAPAAGSDSPGGMSAQRWHEILARFVDDPRGSVTMAADAVNSAMDEFVNSVRARQRALASSWQGSDTDTEQFRTALLDYRNFWQQVQQMRTAQEAAVQLDGKVKPE